ncbi:hypothetical protein [Emticicia sp. 17c]|uniref:hypothetical protein n=1 Tax=Emticicia sp. 17c TaxID=3127704 RepID=UPI00301C37B7
MKRVVYALLLPLVAVGGLVFAYSDTKNEPAKKSLSRPLTAAEMKAQLKIWEATPDGIQVTKWKASPEGKKVLDGAAKIRKYINASANIEAIITSLTLPEGSRLGFGVMACINDEDYILTFDPENDTQLQQLKSLKVNDKIIIKSHSVSYAPKYLYAIVAGNYLERDSKVLYTRTPRKGGC